MKTKDIARVTYDVNKAFCNIIGEAVKPFTEVEGSIVTSVTDALDVHNKSTPGEAHDTWAANQKEDGWEYGLTFDEDSKVDPMLIPYDELPEDTRIKTELFAAVVSSLNAIKEDTPATAEVVPSVSGLAPVQYVGHRSVYRDGLYNTGTVWVKGETKMLPVDKAALLCKHPDVYVPGNANGILISPSSEKEKVQTEEEEFNEALVQEAEESILAMKNKKPILEFAAKNFSSVELNARNTIDELQQETIQMIRQYGIL